MPLYAASIFLGAFLLFQVQPLLGRFILPWFGGTPAVWMTCMLFFQSMLLAGYLYAHLITSRLCVRAAGSDPRGAGGGGAGAAADRARRGALEARTRRLAGCLDPAAAAL